ncbi:MAG: hypothetical protein E7634_09055 [Ruminococcaceae bacterium]|nr:hypothetical protein [Oscillospiraceae bacterium]MBQ9692217.1 site-2 protease family protein [Clostridia bacterium]
MPKIRFDLLSLWMTVLVFWDGSGDTAVTLIAAFLHEMGHVAVMYMNGVGIREIGITPYGFEIVAARQYRSFFEEISVSLAGCAVNFLSAVMLYGFGGILQRLAIASAALGILNIMPISCLDGGVTLNSMLCLGMLPDKADAICRIISFVTLFCIWIPAVYVFMFSGANYSLFVLCVWLFGKLFAPSRFKS